MAQIRGAQPMGHRPAQDAPLIAMAGLVPERVGSFAGDDKDDFRRSVARARKEISQGGMSLVLSHAMQIDFQVDRDLATGQSLAQPPLQWGQGEGRETRQGFARLCHALSRRWSHLGRQGCP